MSNVFQSVSRWSRTARIRYTRLRPLKVQYYKIVNVKFIISNIDPYRLHSTFRHDLKIYASDEGRVQMTAAAFAKGLLALEGELNMFEFPHVSNQFHVII